MESEIDQNPRILPKQARHFMCGKCQRIVYDPVQCEKCGMMSCRSCVIVEGIKKPQCQKCGSEINLEKPFNRVLQNLLNDLEVECPNSALGCREIMKYTKISEHLGSDCPNQVISCPRSKDCVFKCQRKDMPTHLEGKCKICERCPCCRKLLDPESSQHFTCIATIVAEIEKTKQELIETKKKVVEYMRLPKYKKGVLPPKKTPRTPIKERIETEKKKELPMEEEKLVTCTTCGRAFSSTVIARHVEKCGKPNKPRGVFDSKTQRLGYLSEELSRLREKTSQLALRKPEEKKVVIPSEEGTVPPAPTSIISPALLGLPAPHALQDAPSAVSSQPASSGYQIVSLPTHEGQQVISAGVDNSQRDVSNQTAHLEALMREQARQSLTAIRSKLELLRSSLQPK